MTQTCSDAKLFLEEMAEDVATWRFFLHFSGSVFGVIWSWEFRRLAGSFSKFNRVLLGIVGDCFWEFLKFNGV